MPPKRLDRNSICCVLLLSINILNPPGSRKSACWRRGVVVSVVRCMNEVTLRRSRLVLGWVTV